MLPSPPPADWRVPPVGTRLNGGASISRRLPLHPRSSSSARRPAVLKQSAGASRALLVRCLSVIAWLHYALLHKPRGAARPAAPGLAACLGPCQHSAWSRLPWLCAPLPQADSLHYASMHIAL